MALSAVNKGSGAFSGATTRILIPDFTRGLMLLGIVLANIATAWLSPPTAAAAFYYGGIFHDSLWDKIAVVVAALFVHVRGLPMFATLLGYGVGMLLESLQRRGYSITESKRILRRRYFWLAVFGVVHFTFLFYGDIMFFYGIAAVLLVLVCDARDKSLLIIAGAFWAMSTVLMTLGGIILMFIGEDVAGNSASGQSLPGTWQEYLIAPVKTAIFQVSVLPFELFSLFPLVVVGFVASRHHILHQPQRHKKLLIRTVIVGAIVIVGIGLPAGLSAIGVLPSSLAFGFFVVNQALGTLTGPSIIAFLALLLIPVQQHIDRNDRPSVFTLPVKMVAALGKRSMTGYLLQSLILFPLCAPFLLGWLQPRGAANTFVVGGSVWLVTVVIAALLEYFNARGPFEALHRRLSYGRQGLAIAPVGASGGIEQEAMAPNHQVPMPPRVEEGENPSSL